MTDPSKLTSEAAAISTSSAKIRTFAIDAAANIVDLAARVAALEAHPPPAPPPPTPVPVPVPGGSYFRLDMEGAWPPAGAWQTETRRADVLCSGAGCGGISVEQTPDPLGQEGMVARCHNPYDATLPTDSLTHALQLTALYSTSAPLAHAGYNAAVEESWYRYRIMVPAGGVFSCGESNFLMEWHVDAGVSGSGAHSTGVFAYGGYPLVPGGTQSAQWIFRTANGNVDTGAVNQYKYWPSGGSHTLPDAAAAAPVIVPGRWHDHLFHFVWSENPALGLAEWWLDGALQVSLHDATLYTIAANPFGHSYGTVAFYNYRYNVTGDSDIYYSLFTGGPTRASVGG